MDKVKISDEDVVCLASKQQIPNNLDLKNMKDSNNIVNIHIVMLENTLFRRGVCDVTNLDHSVLGTL